MATLIIETTRNLVTFTRQNWRRIMNFVEQEYTCRVMENKPIDSDKKGGSS